MSGLINRVIGVIALIAFLLFAATVTWPDAAGADAPGPDAQHWAEQDVRFIEDAGLWTPPQEAQEVDYDAPLTAAEWNAMVSRLFGAVPGDDNVTGSLRYWLWNYTGAFGSEKGIARADAFGAFMKILNMYGLEGLSSLGPPRHGQVFADWTEIPDPQTGLVDVAVDRGLVRGFPDGTLRPRQPLTLGEAAVFLHRVAEEFNVMERILLPFLPVNLAQQSTGDLRFVLYTDRTTYRMGETVGVVTAVENRSDRDITFTRWNIGDPAVYVRVESLEPGSRMLPMTLEEEGLSPIRLPAVSTATLKPGTAVVQKISWETVFPKEGTSGTGGKGPRRLLPPGKYRIAASFYAQSPASSGEEATSEVEPTEISASVGIEIAGEDTVLVSAEQAQSLVLRHPEAARWWDAHAGRNLVKKENGQWYVNSADGWEKATEEFAVSVANRLPEISVNFSGGLWEIVMICKMGEPPHRMVVRVHPYTGEIVDRKVGER